MELSFTTSAAPPVWDFNSQELEVWADRYGEPCAYGQIVGEESWMYVPRVGSFLLGDDEKPTEVVPVEGVERSIVIDTFYRTVMPTALQLNGCEVLHASAVVMEAGVIALCAPSETGKSTLAYALKERGDPLYADDAVVLRFPGGKPQLQQVPYTIRLRRPSAEHFGATPRESTRVTGELPQLERPADVFAAIFVLERIGRDDPGNDGSLVEVERLGQAKAFPLVLPHAYCFTLRDPQRKSLMMRQYLTLLSYVPVFRLRFRPGLENLEGIVDAIERAVGSLGVTERSALQAV